MNLTKQMAYLKHIGQQQDAKVSIECIEGIAEIHIHDYVFKNFQDALQYLQRDAQNVVRQ